MINEGPCARPSIYDPFFDCTFVDLKMVSLLVVVLVIRRHRVNMVFEKSGDHQFRCFCFKRHKT